MDRLTKKEKGFADDILMGAENRQAIKNNYNLGSKGGDPAKKDLVADQMANETLKKPKVRAYLEENAVGASNRIVELSKNAENETVKLNANKDILDRAGYKPTEKQEHSGSIIIEKINYGQEDTDTPQIHPEEISDTIPASDSESKV